MTGLTDRKQARIGCRSPTIKSQTTPCIVSWYVSTPSHEDGQHRPRKHRALRREPDHEIGDHRHVPEAVGRPPAVQLVAVPGEVEGIDLHKWGGGSIICRIVPKRYLRCVCAQEKAALLLNTNKNKNDDEMCRGRSSKRSRTCMDGCGR